MHAHTISMIKNRKLQLDLKPGKLFYVIFQKYVLLVVVTDMSE